MVVFKILFFSNYFENLIAQSKRIKKNVKPHTPSLLTKKPKMITRNQPHSVLVVDDEPNIVTALEFLLEQEGFHVRKAYNGQQALDTLQRYNDIELVILDVMMPGIDGFEVARQIRNNHLYENLRIIFLTAKGTQKDKITGYSRGAEAYITKPFDNEDLLITVTEMVEFG